MVLSKPNTIKLFVVLAFLATIPTWWVPSIEDVDLHFFIYDLSMMVRISLLPLLAFILIRKNPWKLIFAAYFALTTTNIIGVILTYFSADEWWMTLAKVGGALLILAYLIFITIKDNRWTR